MGAALRGVGNFRPGMVVSTATVVINMVLAPFLIFGWGTGRAFGVAGLLHDIGKVKIPKDILNKPAKLTDSEFKVMKQHVVDGAHILRRTPEMPALAPIVGGSVN